jgi:peptidase YpeB-like protein
MKQLDSHWRWAPLLAALLVAIALLLGSLGFTTAAGAAAGGAVDDNARAVAPLTRTQAQALVQKRYGARVVRVSTADEDGRHVYVFRLLSTAGKVWTVRIDARDGVELP